jgi:hypothetical protein
MIMSLFRPLISLLLTFIAVFIVSCGDGVQAKAPTYSTAQLTQIATANKGLTALRDRLPELATFIQNRDWNNVKSFIHGPLGDIRTRMAGLSRELLPGSSIRSTKPLLLTTIKPPFGTTAKRLRILILSQVCCLKFRSGIATRSAPPRSGGFLQVKGGKRGGFLQV